MRLDGPLDEGESITVQEAIEEFLADCRLRNLSPDTVAWYARRLRMLLGDLVRTPLASLSSAQVREQALRILNTRSASTAKGYVRAAKAFVNWATREGYPTAIHPRQLPRIREPQKLPPTLSVDQIKALLAQPDRARFGGFRDLIAIALMLDTGMRLGELAKLNVGDLDLPLVKIRGKGNKERLVALSPPMQKLLRRYLRAREGLLNDNGIDLSCLLPSRRAARLGARRIQELIEQYGNAANIEGVRVSPHTLRYSFATEFMRNGGNVVKLQQILGHTTLAMTRRYIAMTDADAFDESMRLSPIAHIRLAG